MMCARTCDARGPTPNTLYGSSSAATKTGGEMNTNTASTSSFHIFKRPYAMSISVALSFVSRRYKKNEANS